MSLIWPVALLLCFVFLISVPKTWDTQLRIWSHHLHCLQCLLSQDRRLSIRINFLITSRLHHPQDMRHLLLFLRPLTPLLMKQVRSPSKITPKDAVSVTVTFKSKAITVHLSRPQTKTSFHSPSGSHEGMIYLPFVEYIPISLVLLPKLSKLFRSYSRKSYALFSLTIETQSELQRTSRRKQQRFDHWFL